MSGTLATGRERPSFSALALVLFVSVGAALFIIGNGIPYAYDGAESYLTYLEGYNAVTFPGPNPLVADTAASPDRAAHPSYATHAQDLLARLVSQAFIRAGISDVRAHEAFAIAVTVVALLLAIRVLSRMGGTALAATTIALFAVHYIGFVTWTFSLPVALDFLLFWGNLHLLQRYLERPTGLRLVTAAAGIAVIVVHDLTFGAYVLLIELFALWQLQQPTGPRISFALASGLAAALAIAAWIGLFSLNPGSTALPIAWSPAVEDQQSVAAAYRSMFGLGHGAVILIIYPLLLLELAGLAWPRLRANDVSVPVAVSLAIAATLLLDRSTSLIDDWELVASAPIVRICLWLTLAALLATIAFRLAKAGRAPYPINTMSRQNNTLTTRVFIVAVGLAALLLTLSPIGDFVPRFISGYRPSLVFVEDVILATAVLALVRRIPWRRPWSLESAAALVAIVALGSYWLVYQGKLALRYPPAETTLAAALRGNASLAEANFAAAPDLYPVVWYYTRARVQPVVLPATSREPVRADFLVCATECADQSTLPPPTWATAINPQGLVQIPQYHVYLLPMCESPGLQLACAPQSLADARSVLGSPNVSLTLARTDTGELAHVSYTATPPPGAQSVDSVVRLYALREDGGWCLISEETGKTDFALPNLSSGRLRAGVLSRGAGPEYLSQPIELQVRRLVTLPDIKSGGVQQILAESLQDAEQQALAAGTWNPAAGTYGNDFVVSFDQYPVAESVCRL